jgi:Core-2/I-Branching enzyme
VKLACIVLAHRGPEQLAMMLSAMRHPRVRLYLHLDRRARLRPFTRAISERGVRELIMLPRHRSRWGGPEAVDAALDGLAAGLADGCGYFTLISGQDFPLRPTEEILAFFERAVSRSYVAHWPIPTPRWRFGGRNRTEFYTYNVLGRRETCIPRDEDLRFLNWKGRALNGLLRLRTASRPPRRFPPYARPFGGWSWWNLSHPAAEHVIRFVNAHPDYRRYHEHTLSPDEIFFHSILLGTPFRETHEIVNDSLRFMIWPQGSSHPRTLVSADLPAMIASDKPFARKFDVEVDRAPLAQLAPPGSPIQ